MMPPLDLTPKNDCAVPNMRLAILIDAENAQATIIENLLLKAAEFGEATVTRLYGDFSNQQNSKWKHVLQKFPVKTVQQFAYTSGKNSSDCCLIIDAMDLLYTGEFDGFCLVSSDSDFTCLATRLKESGKKVYGFGETKTPAAFRNACHEFVFTETLRPGNNSREASQADVPALDDAALGGLAAQGGQDLKPPEALASQASPWSRFPVDFLLATIGLLVDEDGWIRLDHLVDYLKKFKSDLEPRAYGFENWTSFFSKHGNLFDTKERQLDDPCPGMLYVRPRLGTQDRTDGAPKIDPTGLPALAPGPPAKAQAIDSPATAAPGGKPPKASLRDLLKKVVFEDEWISLSTFSQKLRQLKDNFSPKHYGYSKFLNLVKSHGDLFDIGERPDKRSGKPDIHVRLRPSLNLAQGAGAPETFRAGQAARSGNQADGDRGANFWPSGTYASQSLESSLGGILKNLSPGDHYILLSALLCKILDTKHNFDSSSTTFSELLKLIKPIPANAATEDHPAKLPDKMAIQVNAVANDNSGKRVDFLGYASTGLSLATIGAAGNGLEAYTRKSQGNYPLTHNWLNS
ncbi:MAG: NYN domain-containing protein [Deltaproteobacteria bacterium]|jgi:uncharacterized LabA/DUF88 family protein|nr:NYN domain-containing protein [Deltaproteobacteria bacterium]